MTRLNTTGFMVALAAAIALCACGTSAEHGLAPMQSTPAAAGATGSGGSGYTTIQDEPTPEELAAACVLECPPAIPGEPGAVGEQGVPGEPGSPGQDGTSCTVAEVPEGAAVTCGDQTVVVHSGSDGTVGPAGERGLTGATGPMGPIGPAGARGDVGPMGETGATGATGATGPAGSDGVIDTSLLYERSDTILVVNDNNSLFVNCDEGDVVLYGGCLTNAGQGGIVRATWPTTSSGASLPDGWTCTIGANGSVNASVKAVCLAVD